MVEVDLWGALRPAAGGKRKRRGRGQDIRELFRKLAEQYPGMEPHIERGIAVSINGKIYRDTWTEKLPGRRRNLSAAAHPGWMSHGRTLLRQGSPTAEDRRRRGIPRRGHPRRHQGAARMRRRLCRRLSGRADLASDGRACRCARTSWPSSACISRRAPARRPPPRRSRPPSTTRSAAPSPSRRRSAPMSPPTRSPISPRAASRAAR